MRAARRERRGGGPPVCERKREERVADVATYGRTTLNYTRSSALNIEAHLNRYNPWSIE